MPWSGKTFAAKTLIKPQIGGLVKDEGMTLGLQQGCTSAASWQRGSTGIALPKHVFDAANIGEFLSRILLKQHTVLLPTTQE